MDKNRLLKLALIATVLPSMTSAETLEERVAKLEKAQMKLGDIDIFGRLQYDKTMIADDSTDLDLQNNSKLRRGRVGVKGSVDGGWKYKFEVDFAGDGSDVTDAYLSKNISDAASIKIGQFKEPFSLEELTSSRFVTFVERALINGFAPGRKIGVGYNRNLGNFNLQTGIFGDAIGTNSDTDDESSSATARLTNYGDIAGSTYHIGGAYRISEPTGDSISYSFKPEASIETSAAKYVTKTGTISDVEKVNQYGLELAYVAGPFSVQGEYISTDLDIDGAEDQSFDGYYGQVSYFLTNDSRNYNKKSSAFDRVKPSSKMGAIEIAYRYSEVDLTEADKGEVANSTAAISWYASNNVRFTANYVWVDADEDTTYADDAEIFALRAQLDF